MDGRVIPNTRTTEPPRGGSPCDRSSPWPSPSSSPLTAARADSKDPLRFFPESTDVVLKVEKPRALVEAVLKHDLAKQAQELRIVRDFLDSANYRRFFQLVAHFEKELGAAVAGADRQTRRRRDGRSG